MFCQIPLNVQSRISCDAGLYGLAHRLARCGLGLRLRLCRRCELDKLVIIEVKENPSQSRTGIHISFLNRRPSNCSSSISLEDLKPSFQVHGDNDLLF